MASPDIDYSMPIASLLRDGTAAAHEKAEHSQGAGWLVRGELDREEYIRFLMMLYHVYSNLEGALDAHATHPTLQPTYNPHLFARTASLSADISHLLQVPETEWQMHYSHTRLVSSPPPALAAYTERLRALAASPDPSPLLAHAYVRYLGDLSGGQFIRRRVAKAYNLEDGSGVSFYDFKQLGGNNDATMGDMKKIKDWYRNGMNEGVGDNTALKAAILEEANIAFALNSGIFTELKAPTNVISMVAALPLLGEPLTPIENGHPVEPEKKESTVVYEASGPPERSFKISSVVALVAALSLAHFFLVIGGFTGIRGSGKLDAFQQWLNSLVSSH